METRMRARLAKLGLVRFTSHLDFMRTVGRTARRAGIPVALTGGFHPHFKIAFGPALGSGIASVAEYADFSLNCHIPEDEFCRRMNSALPSGFRLLEAREIPLAWKSISSVVEAAAYHARLWAPEGAGDRLKEELERRVEAVLAQRSLVVTRQSEKGRKEVDLRPKIIHLEVAGGWESAPGEEVASGEECVPREEEGAPVPVFMIVAAGMGGAVRPEEVLDCILSGRVAELAQSAGSQLASGMVRSTGSRPVIVNRVDITRTGLFLRKGRQLVSPMEAGE